MKKLIFVLVLTWGTCALANNTSDLESSLHELVPDGYVVTKEIHGDLNKDNQDDVVLLIKQTDPNNIVTDEYRGELDHNPRGIVVALRNQQQYEVVVANTSCFHPEDADGGVYFAPDISISIKNGNLYIYYGHGRYGYWRYNFRYQNSDFELIGFDSSANRGPIVEEVVSINFLTKMKLVKKNISELADTEEEVFEESWAGFVLENRFKLSEISELGGRFAYSLREITD
ncbi:hypothetical protein [Nitrincola sp.]|uniref:hypothetical protein n=1 Tax=Nitrincola sp. TaxID=1926584 RepID=UPI003A8D1801